MLLATCNMEAQNTSPGYFRYSKLDSLLLVRKDAMQWLSACEQHLNDSLYLLETHLQKSYYTLFKWCYIDSTSARLMNNQLIQKNHAIETYREYARRRYQKEQQQTEHRIREEILLVTQRFANTHQIRYLHEQTAWLMCETCTDYTQEIIYFARKLRKDRQAIALCPSRPPKLWHILLSTRR